MNLDVHPAAAIFPMLSDAELKEMATSIQAYGLREKIGVVPSDDENTLLVLDGRNRMAALRLLNVKDEAIIENYTTPIELVAYSAEEYVLMANIERRNLGANQRRELAGKLAVMLAERQKSLPKSQQVDTTAEAAKKAGVSRRTAATAKQEVLNMAASHSETDANPPAKKKAKSKSKVKAGPKRPPANIAVVLGEMAEDVNTYGHNFTLDEMQAIQGKTKILLDYADSKLGSIAEHAQKEAERIAAEAAKVAAATKAARS